MLSCDKDSSECSVAARLIVGTCPSILRLNVVSKEKDDLANAVAVLVGEMVSLAVEDA